MAKTVDNFSTLVNFRDTYNELATDVGDKSGLRTSETQTLVDAINSVEDKSFFFQEFIYVATSSQTAFTGDDSFGNELSFRGNRIQVFKNTDLLIEGTDYTISAADSQGLSNTINLISGASVSDKISIFAFTGSYLGTVASGVSGESGFFTETASNTIYNLNTNGIVFNSTDTPVTSLESGYGLQLEGDTFVNGDMKIDTGHTFESPSISDGTATITGGVGTGFTNVTSTGFSGNISGTTASFSTAAISSAITGTPNITGGQITTNHTSNTGGFARNTYQSTSAPTTGDGQVGDVWILYS